MTTKTILLASNEPTIREVLQACLADLGGLDVLATNISPDGLRQAEEKQPDAIILSLTTAADNGLVFLEKLKQNAKTQDIPVVLLIGRAKWLSLNIPERYYISGVVSDSMEPTLLLEKVKAILGWDILP
ncbi:MAG TPA: response regulator [Chroococcidiopsis sp.]